MIKIFALIFMAFDHVGRTLRVFSPKLISLGYFSRMNDLAAIFILIGRLSMPMFAYCIARGFDHYEKNGNIKKYFKNLAIFSVVSQVPFLLVFEKVNSTFFGQVRFSNLRFVELNIGFTWLFAIIILFLFSRIKNDFLMGELNFTRIGFFILSVLVVVFIPMDYDLYGVLNVFLFYIFCFKFKSSILLFVSDILLYIGHCVFNGIDFIGKFNNQMFSIFAVFLILYFQKFDEKVRLPKLVFYLFYPVHLAALWLGMFLLNI